MPVNMSSSSREDKRKASHMGPASSRGDRTTKRRLNAQILAMSEEAKQRFLDADGRHYVVQRMLPGGAVYTGTTTAYHKCDGRQNVR